MNTAKHQKQIKRLLEGIYNLSPKASEPYFGKTSCNCCGSDIAGDRYELTGTLGLPHTSRRVELSCCRDCYLYFFT